MSRSKERISAKEQIVEEEDIIKFLKKVSEEAEGRRKGRKLAVDPHSIYEQFEKRERRAGL